MKYFMVENRRYQILTLTTPKSGISRRKNYSSSQTIFPGEVVLQPAPQFARERERERGQRGLWE